MDLTLLHIRMLCAVANHGTIAAAAEALGYTPSGVSQQLAGLERAVGQPVLERVGRNVRLTDAGRILVDQGADILDRVDAALTDVARSTTTVAGTIVVTVYESIAATVLADALSELHHEYPELSVRTRQMEPDAAVEAVQRGDVDLAFAIDYSNAPAPQHPDVVRFALIHDRFRVVVPEDDPLPTDTVTLSQLSHRRLIASPPDTSCGRCVLAACRAAGFEPDVTHELDDYATALRLVAGGHGIALVPDLGLFDLPLGVRTVPIEDPPLYRVIELAARRSSADRPALVAVRRVFKERLERRLPRSINSPGVTPPTS